MTTEKMFLYITDCQLATLETLALRKSSPKSEFERQFSIYKKCVDWVLQNNLDYHGTRIVQIVKCGSLENWLTKLNPLRFEKKN